MGTQALNAIGMVLSKEPLATLTADLRNHELVLVVRLPDYHPVQRPQNMATIRIGDEATIADIIRFAKLAQRPLTPRPQAQCWRCELWFEAAELECNFCTYVNGHCPQCSQYLHTDQL